jgi:hypothetical protein
MSVLKSKSTMRLNTVQLTYQRHINTYWTKLFNLDIDDSPVIFQKEHAMLT